MIGHREVMLDLPFLEQVVHSFVLELQSVICLDMSGATKATINVSVDEVRNFSSSLLRERGCFWPSCETFNCDCNEAFSSRSERERADQIDFPSVKESFNRDWSCLLSVCGSCLQLAGFTVLHIILHVLKDVKLPKASVETNKSVVDTGMSFLIIELAKGKEVIFSCFKYLVHMLAILLVKESILEKVA